MKNNYKIISDPDALKEFIEWLPELEDNEKFYLSLFARKKYCPELIKSNDKTQLKRFVTDKKRMFNKIQQLELQLGRWELRGQAAPQESLVLYIHTNPRCMTKATEMLGKKCWELFKNKNYNLVAESMSCIQKSKSRTYVVDFDIDTKDITLDIPWLNENLGSGAYNIVETRGGYHLLVSPQSVEYMTENKNWYQKIVKKYPVDQSGDQMLPIPGTIQGGFVPKFII